MSTDQTKVPIFATAWRAYQFVFQNALQILLSFVLLALVWWVPIYLIPQFTPPLLANLLNAVWGTITVAPFAVMIHRSIVLNETLEAKNYFSCALDPRVTSFILIGLLLYVVPSLLPTLSVFLLETSVALTAILYLAYFAIVIYLLRYLFAFPEIATDRFAGLRQTRMRMKGAVNRTFWASMVAMIPYFVFFFMLNWPPPTEPTEMSPFASFSGLILVVIMPAVLSFAYLHHVGSPAETSGAQVDS